MPVDTETMSLFFALLAVVANTAVVGALVVIAWARLSPGGQRVLGGLRALALDVGLPGAWFVALVATLGSLFYSEVANFTPCELCWYQRIAMYPLVVVLGIAAFRRDVNIKRYVLPVVVIGGAISVYHYLIQRFPDWTSASCDPTAPCTVTWVWQFHYISIPFMALSAFALIATLLLVTPTEGSIQ